MRMRGSVRTVGRLPPDKSRAGVEKALHGDRHKHLVARPRYDEVIPVYGVPANLTAFSALYDDIKSADSRYRNLLTESNRPVKRLKDQRRAEGAQTSSLAAIAAPKDAYAGTGSALLPGAAGAKEAQHPLFTCAAKRHSMRRTGGWYDDPTSASRTLVGRRGPQSGTPSRFSAHSTSEVMYVDGPQGFRLLGSD